ncbi:MAG: thioesterase family protein [Lachnospiraceae bacterium]|nr:thioesterase family protein [Lachnospiraceae bacterium]
METGSKKCVEEEVTKERTAKHVGSGSLEVYATPSMIALMEYTSTECIKEFLEEGQTSVGTALNVKHVSATPVGMKVRCESELIKVDGRALTFSVKVYDEKGLIGEGEHQRFIVDGEKFIKKTYGKFDSI